MPLSDNGLRTVREALDRSMAIVQRDDAKGVFSASYIICLTQALTALQSFEQPAQDGGDVEALQEPDNAATQKDKYHRVLKEPKPGDTVAIKVERGESDIWVITCDQLPGLLLVHQEFENACNQIGFTVAQMYHFMEHGEFKHPDPDADPRIKAAEFDSWRPIRTAPKDGTEILLWWPHWSSKPCIGRYVDDFGRGWEADCALSDQGVGPLSWQPLPAPPTAGKAR